MTKNPVVLKLADWVVRRYIGDWIADHATKIAALYMTLGALVVALSCLITPLELITEGKYSDAIQAFDYEAFGAAVAGVPITLKVLLGIANQTEKAAPAGTEMHAEVAAEAVKQGESLPTTPSGI